MDREESERGASSSRWPERGRASEGPQDQDGPDGESERERGPQVQDGPGERVVCRSLRPTACQKFEAGGMILRGACDNFTAPILNSNYEFIKFVY